MQNSERIIYAIVRTLDNRLLGYRMDDPHSGAEIPAGYHEETILPSTDNAYIASHRRPFLLNEIDCAATTAAAPLQTTYTPSSGVVVA